MKKDTLYYDGQCPLCSVEMDRLGKLACERLALVDIHTLEGDAIDKDALLKRLHLETEAGFVTGLEANIAAWQHTRWGWLWRCLQWPIIKPVATAVYDRWAERRFEKRYGNSAAKEPRS